MFWADGPPNLMRGEHGHRNFNACARYFINPAVIKSAEL
jgi:hypothetical protein